MLDRIIIVLLALSIACAVPAKKWKLEFDMPGVVQDIAKITGLGEKLISRTQNMPNNVKLEIETPDTKEILSTVKKYIAPPNGKSVRTYTDVLLDKVEKKGKELKNMILDMGKGLSSYVDINVNTVEENNFVKRSDDRIEEKKSQNDDNVNVKLDINNNNENGHHGDSTIDGKKRQHPETSDKPDNNQENINQNDNKIEEIFKDMYNKWQTSNITKLNVKTNKNQENNTGDDKIEENQDIKNNSHENSINQNGDEKNRNQERIEIPGFPYKLWESKRRLKNHKNLNKHVEILDTRRNINDNVAALVNEGVYVAPTNVLSSPGTYKTLLHQYPPYYHQNKVRVLMRIKADRERRKALAAVTEAATEAASETAPKVAPGKPNRRTVHILRRLNLNFGRY